MPFRIAIDQDLDRLTELEANWDAQGAGAIESWAIEAARQFIDRLPEDSVPAPDVVPMAKGNLQFEWHDGTRSLEFEFEYPAQVHYLKWDPDESIEEEGFFRLEDTSRAMALISWFTRGLANG